MYVERGEEGREGEKGSGERDKERQREKKYQRSMQFTDRLFCLDFYTSKHVNVWPRFIFDFFKMYWGPRFFICNKGVYSPHLLLKEFNDS